MLRNASIRTRVLAILAPLVLVLLLAAGTRIASSVRTARQAEQLSQVARTEQRAIDLVSALDDERVLTQQVLSGDAAQKAALAKARTTTDPLLAAEGAALAQVDPTRLEPQVRRSVDAALGAGRRVSALRTAVDASIPSPATAVNRYDAIIDDQVVLPARLASAVDDASTADALRATTSLQQLSQLLVAERDQGRAALADSDISPDERLGLAGVQAQEVAQRTDAAALARSAGVRVPAVSPDLVAARAAALGGATGGPSTLRPAQWVDVVNADVARLTPARDALRTAATAGVEDQADAARRTAWLNALAAILVLLLALGLALVFARRLTEPLRALTAAAGVVRERLPRLVEQAQGAPAGEEDPPGDDLALPVLPVRSSDEVGRLAAAFNEVNATSLSVAREQAALREAIAATFVTLARRDQALLARQLSFIDTLERAEEDPEVLDDLFVLDHLATRMRRNAESLLVLAGLEGGRRLRGPLALSDVARTATSEVEDYRRVRLVLDVDPAVLGHLALGASHLLAELLENALTASDPLTEVVVSSTRGPDGSVVLSVSDQGLGMTPDQRERAAARIADPSATAALGSSQLGFFVVGRLARRLGAAIALRPGEAGGTVVDVALPRTALVPGSVISSASAAAALVTTAEVEAVLAADVAPVPDVIDLRERPQAPAQAPAAVPAPVPAGARSAVFAGFRSRRPSGATAVGARDASAADPSAAEAGAPDAGATRAAPPAPATAAAMATAARRVDWTASTGAYTPARPTPAVTAPPRAPVQVPAAAQVPAPAASSPFTPALGEGAPLTRRERRAVETGRIPAVGASATPPPAPAAPPATAQYQPDRVEGSATTLSRRRHAASAPEVAAVPADGQRSGLSASRTGQTRPTPSGATRAVPESDAPRRRDPAEVRRLLAGYQSGVVRARAGMSAPTSIPTPVVRGAAAADVQEHA